MLVEKNNFKIIMAKSDTTEVTISSTKFYEVAVSKNLKTIQKVFDAKESILRGGTVDGRNINLPGLTFRKAE